MQSLLQKISFYFHCSLDINKDKMIPSAVHKRIHPLAAFGQTLLALKICNARNVYYRFSALIASARTQPLRAASAALLRMREFVPRVLQHCSRHYQLHFHFRRTSRIDEWRRQNVVSRFAFLKYYKVLLVNIRCKTEYNWGVRSKILRLNTRPR